MISGVKRGTHFVALETFILSTFLWVSALGILKRQDVHREEMLQGNIEDAFSSGRAFNCSTAESLDLCTVYDFVRMLCTTYNITFTLTKIATAF